MIEASSPSTPILLTHPPTSQARDPHDPAHPNPAAPIIPTSSSAHPVSTSSTHLANGLPTSSLPLNIPPANSNCKNFNPTTPPKPSHVRRPNWSTSEDEQLCRSWLENSFDPVTNAIQKGTQFWNRVADDFATRGPGQIERNKDHVRNRWQLLQAKVIKFTLCYDRVHHQSQPNEKSQDEIISEALRLYEREESHKFTFYSSWLILRNSDRWIQWSSHTGQKRSISSSTNLHHHHLHHHPISDIAVSPHSTVSLLDSDESPTTLDQPLNRFIPSGPVPLPSFHPPYIHHSPSAPSKPDLKPDRSIPVHTLDPDDHHHHHSNHPNQDSPDPIGNRAPHPYSMPSSAPPSLQYHPPTHYRGPKYTTKRCLTRLESEHESSDRLMAMAIKRKADVQEAALEVQLLAIDPEQIADPLRKEVYMMKMEEIRDRYKAKRSKPSTSVLIELDHPPPHHHHQQQQQQHHDQSQSDRPSRGVQVDGQIPPQASRPDHDPDHLLLPILHHHHSDLHEPPDRQDSQIPNDSRLRAALSHEPAPHPTDKDGNDDDEDDGDDDDEDDVNDDDDDDDDPNRPIT